MSTYSATETEPVWSVTLDQRDVVLIGQLQNWQICSALHHMYVRKLLILIDVSVALVTLVVS